VLLGAALTTLVLRRVVRGHLPDAAFFALEGGTGLAFAGVLIALTGGALSPFAFLVPLIVVGAALVVTPGVALALTAGAGAVYVAAIAVAAAGTPGEPSVLAVTTAGINLTALCLVAYVGMAIGREQRRAREDAHRLATEDALTGLRTRPSLFGSLERELARSGRTGRGFCLLMIDLDDLKSINDRFGHWQGDRALRLVGQVIRNGIRQIDTGARFGGDEFVVLLPETDTTGGWVLAEKIRRGVAEGGLEADGVPIPTSVSVGLVTYPRDGETVGALLERADAAMYRSKRAGRDRVTGVPVMAPVLDPVLDQAPAPAGPPGRPV
jgi:diguanylate cyclase (GGDEF)-like protein